MGIDRERFRAWLEEHDPDAAVGHVWTSTDCALAHFLNETRGGRWSVGCCAVDIGADRDRVREPLAPWAWTFLERVDRLRTVNHSDDPLTAREALLILESIEGSPLVEDTIVDLTQVRTEEEERELAKARHPSNASNAAGEITAATAGL